MYAMVHIALKNYFIYFGVNVGYDDRPQAPYKVCYVRLKDCIMVSKANKKKSGLIFSLCGNDFNTHNDGCPFSSSDVNE